MKSHSGVNRAAKHTFAAVPSAGWLELSIRQLLYREAFQWVVWQWLVSHKNLE